MFQGSNTVRKFVHVIKQCKYNYKVVSNVYCACGNFRVIQCTQQCIKITSIKSKKKRKNEMLEIFSILKEGRKRQKNLKHET